MSLSGDLLRADGTCALGSTTRDGAVLECRHPLAGTTRARYNYARRGSINSSDLTDGTNNYIYGPEGVPVQHINSGTGTVLYLHHDQQGSTRMLTSSTGTKDASFTYDSYGNTTGTTGTAKTPAGCRRGRDEFAVWVWGARRLYHRGSRCGKCSGVRSRDYPWWPGRT
jgi:hypothetical protein